MKIIKNDGTTNSKLLKKYTKYVSKNNIHNHSLQKQVKIWSYKLALVALINKIILAIKYVYPIFIRIS
jgi:hypothetical protein